jgi:exonuclease III
VYDIVFSLPKDRHNATGFGGKVHGVAALIRQDFTPHVLVTRKSEWDLEGRILIHEISTGIIVINGYYIKGNSGPYRNPVTGQLDDDRHALKLRYHSRILDEILEHESQGRQVVLVGDMNVAPQSIGGHPNLRTSPVQHAKNRHDFNLKFFLDKCWHERR